MEGGSATLPVNLISPPTTTSPTEDPQPWVLPSWGVCLEVATGSEPVFVSHPRIQSPVVVHESPQYVVMNESPPPPPQPNTVGPIPPQPSPRRPAYVEHVNGILGGGGIPLVGGRLHRLMRAPQPRRTLRGGPLVPPWQGGLLGEVVVGHLCLGEGGVQRFNILGSPLKHGGRRN